MRAIAIFTVDEKPVLREIDAPEPVPGPNDLLVSVRAAGINRADLLRHAAHYGHADTPASAPIAGLELAGEVLATGSAVTQFRVGDRVMAMASRAYAQKAVVDARLALPVPARMSWPEAAATSVSFMTAHDALCTNGGLSAGKSVLIQAVTSGAGLAALQIAHALGAKPVMGTSASPAKMDRLRDLGLDVAINARADDVVEAVKAATDGRGADVIMDNIGKGVLQQNIDCAAVRGRIVQVGRMGGYVDSLNLDELARKRVSLIGVTFRTRSIEEHAAVCARFVAEILPMLADGRIKPLIDRVFPLEQAEAAQDYMRSNAHLGKVVLSV